MDGPLRGWGGGGERVSHAVRLLIIVHACKDEVVCIYLYVCVRVALGRRCR